jgi:formylglycine-generating enzyme required for sulfatase activity
MTAPAGEPPMLEPSDTPRPDLPEPASTPGATREASSARRAPPRRRRRRRVALALLGVVVAGVVWLILRSSWPSGSTANLVALADGGALVIVLEGGGSGRGWLVRGRPDSGVQWRLRLDDATLGTTASLAVGSEAVALHHNFGGREPAVIAVHRLDTGRLLWKRPADLPGMVFGAPQLELRQGLLLQYARESQQGGDHLLVLARDAATGAERWRTTVPAGVTSVLERPGRLFYLTGRRVVAVDATDGQSWDVPVESARSLCVDGDRLFSSSGTDVLVQPLSPDADPQHAWALPPPLRGASLARCGRYGRFDVLTFERQSSHARMVSVLTSGDWSRLDTTPFPEAGAALALLFIDRETSTIDAVLDLTGPHTGAVALQLLDRCGLWSPVSELVDEASRCALGGELTRFVPLLALAAESPERWHAQLFVVDLDGRSATLARRWPQTSFAVPALHRDRHRYVVVGPQADDVVTLDGETGRMRRSAVLGASGTNPFGDSSGVGGGRLWLANGSRSSVVDLGTGDELAVHDGGLGLGPWGEAPPPILPEAGAAVAIPFGRTDILPLYLSPSTATPAGEDELLGAWVRIEGGSYRQTARRWPEEEGERLVVVSRPYFVMATEVTRAQWEAVMGRPAPAHGWRACLEPECPAQPNSWRDLYEFANRASEHLGFPPCYSLEDVERVVGPSDCEGLRLPTAAEWENAALGGRASPDPCAGVAGCDPDSDECWSVRTTLPVTQFPPNPFGLHGAPGNAMEAIGDYWDVRGAGREVNPVTRHGTERLVGGTRRYHPACDFAVTVMDLLGTFFEESGFRLVRSAHPTMVPGD